MFKESEKSGIILKYSILNMYHGMGTLNNFRGLSWMIC